MDKVILRHAVITIGASAAFEEVYGSTLPALSFLHRHSRGDWGDLDAHDRAVNESQLMPDGEVIGQVLSAFALADGTRIYVVTNDVTTILLPEEY